MAFWKGIFLEVLGIAVYVTSEILNYDSLSLAGLLLFGVGVGVVVRT